uniref:Ig-like domain-containing protein n=1 Tax=Xenopus tropicalis TaxID=8364 RepID=A0A803KKW8_XENTR
MGPPSLSWFLLISLSLTGTDALGVKTSDVPIKSPRNQEAFIPCTITDYGAGRVDPKLLSVVWKLKPLNGSEEQVYLYVSGTHTPTRPGSYISSDLITGNVGLHLPRVQFTDEGEYTCTVIYTPNKAWGQSVLQVSVQPTVSLQYTDLSILLETEKTVQCAVGGFYPKDIKIKWVKRLSETNCISLDKESCTGDTSGNEDGTFNVTSHLTIKPSLEDHGIRYLCVIEHRSLDTELKLGFTLSVTEPPPEDKTTAPVVITVCVLLITLGLCYFLYLKFLKKEPPKLSPITGAEHLVHMNEATLSCQISGFRPKPIRITLCLQRKGGERMEIYSWDSEAQTDHSIKRKELSVPIELEREGLVGNGETNLPPTQRALRVEMVPLIKTSKKHISNCQCTIRITPDIEEDDGAELTVRVTHSALRGPISKSCRLKVNGVPPTISDIVPPLRILNEEPVTLTCPINGFKPKPLSVTWLKVDSGGREAELLSWDRGSTDIRDPKYSHQMLETEHGEHSNAFISVLAMKPTVKEDHGAKYICRTYHYATGSRADKTMEMLVSAAPELGPIQKSPEILYVGEEMTLSCRIHSFHPEPLKVRWYKGDELLASSTDQAHRGASHLLDCTSRATYRPSVRDIGKSFRCEVSHESLQHPKCVSWELKHLVSEPRVSAIKCHPEAPECNQPATLSCAIENYYPKDLKIRWYRGLEVISSHNDTETKEDPPGSGLFSKMTEIHLTPTLSDHGTEFHMEIIHNMKITKKTFCLQFKGFPEVKDITCNKYPPKYGEALTLSCEVIGCSARDITAEWREGNNPIRGQMRAEPQTDRDSVTFLLTLTPTAEHYGKLLTCLIKHKDLPQPIKKNISLKLPDVPPTLSEITASPGEPIINRETTLSVTISGFSQKNLQVRWYNSFMPLTANIQTTEPRIGGDRLYCCTSSVTYTPKISDTGMSIRCEVIANRETRERRYQLPIASGDEGDGRNQPKAASGDQLDGRNQPEIGEIECVTPPSPREGEAVTLQCIIRGQDVEHGDFSWSDGMFPIDESQIDNSNLPDGSGCISRVTFTPDDGQIRFEATFNLVTTERTYQLPWV